MKRGAIHTPSRAKQLIDYSGMLFDRGITPTDIDGFIEFNDEISVFLEFKFGETEMPFGQRLALERLVDDCSEKKEAMLLVATHDTDPEDQIQAHSCSVTMYRYKGKWHQPREPVTVRKAVERFLDWIETRSPL